MSRSDVLDLLMETAEVIGSWADLRFTAYNDGHWSSQIEDQGYATGVKTPGEALACGLEHEAKRRPSKADALLALAARCRELAPSKAVELVEAVDAATMAAVEQKLREINRAAGLAEDATADELHFWVIVKAAQPAMFSTSREALVNELTNAAYKETHGLFEWHSRISSILARNLAPAPVGLPAAQGAPVDREALTRDIVEALREPELITLASEEAPAAALIHKALDRHLTPAPTHASEPVASLLRRVWDRVPAGIPVTDVLAEVARIWAAETETRTSAPAPASGLDAALVARLEQWMAFVTRTVGPSNNAPGIAVCVERDEGRQMVTDLRTLLNARAPAPAFVDTALAVRVLEELAVLESRTKDKPADGVVPVLAGRLQRLVPDVRALLAARAPAAAADALAPGLPSFVDAMKVKLQANAHKGGWLECQVSQLLPRIYDEVLELVQAAARGADAVTILGEAADVANFAMMVVDIVYARGLTNDDRARCLALAVQVGREKSAPAELAEERALVERLRADVVAVREVGRQEVLATLDTLAAEQTAQIEGWRGMMDEAARQRGAAQEAARRVREGLAAKG